MKIKYLNLLFVLLLFTCKTLGYKKVFYEKDDLKVKLFGISSMSSSSSFVIEDLITEELIYYDKIENYEIYKIANINKNYIQFIYSKFIQDSKEYKSGVLEYNLDNKFKKDLGAVEDFNLYQKYSNLISVEDNENECFIYDINKNLILKLDNTGHPKFAVNVSDKKIYYLNGFEIRCYDLILKNDYLIYEFSKDQHLIVGIIDIKDSNLFFENVSLGEFHYLSFININDKKIYDLKIGIMGFKDFKLISE